MYVPYRRGRTLAEFLPGNMCLPVAYRLPSNPLRKWRICASGVCVHAQGWRIPQGTRGGRRSVGVHRREPSSEGRGMTRRERRPPLSTRLSPAVMSENVSADDPLEQKWGAGLDARPRGFDVQKRRPRNNPRRVDAVVLPSAPLAGGSAPLAKAYWKRRGERRPRLRQPRCDTSRASAMLCRSGELPAPGKGVDSRNAAGFVAPSLAFVLLYPSAPVQSSTPGRGRGRMGGLGSPARTPCAPPAGQEPRKVQDHHAAQSRSIPSSLGSPPTTDLTDR